MTQRTVALRLSVPLGLLAVLVVAALTASRQRPLGAREPAPGTADRSCNVVLITIDTLRPDHMTSYGYALDTTPCIEEVFRAGTVFANAVSSAPCTNPSIPHLLRGSLHTKAPSIAETLRDHGYVTAAVVSQSQFHLEPDQYRMGFDHWDIQPRGQVDAHDMSTRGADEVTSRAIRWLSSPRREGPFFLWVHYFDPHDPYEPPRDFRRFDPGGAAFEDGDRRARQQRAARQTGQKYYEVGQIFTPPDVAHFIGLYDGEIACVDREIGRFFDACARLRLDATTAFFLTSDHGERLGEDGLWDHCVSLHEREIRVPLMMRLPRGRPLPSRIDGAVSTLDIFPTVLEVVGVDGSHLPLQGKSLLHAGEGRRTLAAFGRSFAVRDKDHKLYVSWTGDLPWEAGMDAWGLVRTTPGLDEIPMAMEQEPGLRDDLAQDLHRMSGFDVRTARRGEEILEKLRALGYTQ